MYQMSSMGSQKLRNEVVVTYGRKRMSSDDIFFTLRGYLANIVITGVVTAPCDTQCFCRELENSKWLFFEGENCYEIFNLFC